MYFVFFIIVEASGNENGAIECGKIVSRVNKALFDYQIGRIIKKVWFSSNISLVFLGDKSNTSVITSVFTHRIILTIPGTKQVDLNF